MRHLLENGRIEKIADDSDEIRQSHKRGQIVTLAVINADVHVFSHPFLVVVENLESRLILSKLAGEHLLFFPSW